MTGTRRLLLIGLLTILIALIIIAHVGTIWVGPRLGVDVRIPLLAAERWLAGDAPYLEDAFTTAPGGHAAIPLSALHAPDLCCHGGTAA